MRFTAKSSSRSLDTLSREYAGRWGVAEGSWGQSMVWPA